MGGACAPKARPEGDATRAHAAFKTEPEKELRRLGERLATIVKDGDAALDACPTAVASTPDHGVPEIVTHIDDVNNARRLMYGILVQRAVDVGLRRDWPNRFFRRTQRELRKALPATPPVPARARYPRLFDDVQVADCEVA